jgi:hypothetical protein
MKWKGRPVLYFSSILYGEIRLLGAVSQRLAKAVIPVRKNCFRWPFEYIILYENSIINNCTTFTAEIMVFLLMKIV